MGGKLESEEGRQQRSDDFSTFDCFTGFDTMSEKRGSPNLCGLEDELRAQFALARNSRDQWEL